MFLIPFYLGHNRIVFDELSEAIVIYYVVKVKH